MRHTARFPPAVGVCVPDDPFLRPPPTPPRSASPRRGGVPPPPGVELLWASVNRRGCGRRSRPQRGDPRRGSPLYPLLRFFGDGGFRALRRASKGSAPGPRPLFCKKAGQKTFTGPDFRQPKPLAPGASDSIRPRSGHLSGRVAPPTRVGEAGGSRNLMGAPPPHKRFSLGLHPVSLGKTKEMGWNRQHKVKTTKSKTASSSTPKTPPKQPL